MIIEAEIGGHCVHHRYMDGGSASKIQYEHYFNRLRPKKRRMMVPATTPVIGFGGNVVWLIGQIILQVKIGDEEHATSAWMKFESFMSKQGYTKTTPNHCVFVQKIDKLKKELHKCFAMKDLGEAKQILGMRISRDRKAKKLWLSQEMYIEKILERFRMHKAKLVGTSLAGNF